MNIVLDSHLCHPLLKRIFKNIQIELEINVNLSIVYFFLLKSFTLRLKNWSSEEVPFGPFPPNQTFPSIFSSSSSFNPGKIQKKKRDFFCCCCRVCAVTSREYVNFWIITYDNKGEEWKLSQFSPAEISQFKFSSSFPFWITRSFVRGSKRRKKNSS